MQMREKVGKSRNTVFFQWFVAPEGRKVGSLKRRVRSQLARWEMKNCTPLWREAHFEVKMYKTPQDRTTFGSWDVEKVHAVVARSTFPSQNAQNTTCSRHFWRFRCRKSARRCGAKHISKSKCYKHQGLGPLLEVQMSLRFASLQYTTLHYTTLHYTTLHNTTTITTQLHYTTLHNTTTITTHYTPLHSTTLNYYTTLHYTTLHYLPLHLLLTLHYTPLHYSYNYNYTTTHYTPLHYITLHYITLHSTTLQLHYTTLHYATLH